MLSLKKFSGDVFCDIIHHRITIVGKPTCNVRPPRRHKVAHHPKVSLENIVKDFFDGFVEIVAEVSKIHEKIDKIEERTSISEIAKKKLMENSQLLDVIDNIINFVDESRDVKIKVRKIDVGEDPEIPNWRPLEVHIIVEGDIEETLRKWNELSEKIYKNIDENVRKNIYILVFPSKF